VQGVGEQGEELRLRWGRKTLANSFTRTYAKFGWGEKVHLQAQAHFSYETIVLKGRQYDLLKVEMRTREGKKYKSIFPKRFSQTCRMGRNIVFDRPR
jgi:hypothetical protein